MRKQIINKLLIGVTVICSLSACDFEEINTNPYEPKNVLPGQSITTMQTSVVPIGTQADGTNVINQYQIAYHLSADVWSGYFGQNNYWYSGYNNTNNYLVDQWISASYKHSYTVVVPVWKSIKEQSKEMNTPELFALAQILKISTWHKATDMFGPIPYKKAGEPILVVPYDSQEEVYKSFFIDLDAAIEVLSERAKVNIPIAPEYDAVYAGNATKWVKYANSLMLRLAMRIRYADPVTAQKYAEKAIEHPIGVMTTQDDEAKMSVGAGLNFVNNIETFANQYGECRMGWNMFSYLLGYEDPRLSAYFKPSESKYAVEAFDKAKYQAIPTGHYHNENDVYKSFSKPNIEKSTPTYWMRASEVYFLRAEGALENWKMGGEAKSLYEQGIAQSFSENGIKTEGVENYMKSGKKPITYELYANEYSAYSSAPCETTTEFKGEKEKLLEKIIIQKWIALYPNGQEAWSEWRRTGYPKLHELIIDMGYLGPEGVRRMNYPTGSYQSEKDRANIEEAIKLLGGEDKPWTKLWWDAKEMPKEEDK